MKKKKRKKIKKKKKKKKMKKKRIKSMKIITRLKIIILVKTKKIEGENMAIHQKEKIK